MIAVSERLQQKLEALENGESLEACLSGLEPEERELLFLETTGFTTKTVKVCSLLETAMKEISMEELVAADVSPIDTTLLAQTPIDQPLHA